MTHHHQRTGTPGAESAFFSTLLEAQLDSRFIGTTGDGEFRHREDWLTEAVGSGAALFPTEQARASSIRIHGNLAIVNLRVTFASGKEAWRTIVAVKDNGRWVLAGLITTPITGAA